MAVSAWPPTVSMTRSAPRPSVSVGPVREPSAGSSAAARRSAPRAVGQRRLVGVAGGMDTTGAERPRRQQRHQPDRTGAEDDHAAPGAMRAQRTACTPTASGSTSAPCSGVMPAAAGKGRPAGAPILGEAAAATGPWARAGQWKGWPATTELAVAAGAAETDRVEGDQIADAHRPGVVRWQRRPPRLRPRGRRAMSAARPGHSRDGGRSHRCRRRARAPGRRRARAGAGTRVMAIEWRPVWMAARMGLLPSFDGSRSSTLAGGLDRHINPGRHGDRR